MAVVPRGLLRPLCVLLFVCGVVIPLALVLVANNRDLSNSYSLSVLQSQTMMNAGHERKPLDYSEMRDNSEPLRTQIKEMQQIKLSVLNELRELEKERSDLYMDVQTNKDSLVLIKKRVSLAKTELQEARSKLAKAQRETNHNCRGDISSAPINPAPIVVVNMPHTDKSVISNVRRSLTTHSTSCTFEECFNYSRCSLGKPFSVYVYNLHSPFDTQFKLQPPNLLDTITASLTDKHTITSDPQSACIFLVIGIKPTSELESLPYWGTDGSNHVVVDLSCGDISLLKEQPTNKAIYASIFSLRTNYDVTLAPVLRNPPTHLWKGLPRHLPAFRQVLLYFEGEFSDARVDSRLGMNDAWISASDIEFLSISIHKGSTDIVKVVTSCKKSDDRANVNAEKLGEWKLCGDSEYRVSSLTKSTYTLILGSRTGSLGAATHTRLIEALQFGSIPVLLGVKSLPFDCVIDWKRAAINVPAPRVGDLHYILRNIQPNTVLEYRRQGQFLWKTYFSSTSSVVDTTIAFVRYRAYHAPPSAEGYSSFKSLLTVQGSSKLMISPAYQQNFTVYSTEFWNHPPGPFFMYPLTPFTSGPVSGSQYEGLDSAQLPQLPPHVIHAGGITGPYFQDYLLGNTPPEQFTVVMLTYERDAVLMEAIKRLDDLDGLAKVVVMWNSPSPPSKDLNWPTIKAPVEVVSVGRNSLNNRFLPLSNIQTEAVLSLDDDVHLRDDEIQFAFRVWREARDRIVGFPGRFHAWDVRHASWLYNSNYTCELSMVLTGAAFLHKYYLYLYSNWMPQAIRDIVDEFTNCEDIAMNFLVSHITRSPPLKVTSRWTFRCPGCPENLSSNHEHFNERHICMNRFVEVYGYMPLLYTQFRLDSVLFKTRLPSQLEKCYQFV